MTSHALRPKPTPTKQEARRFGKEKSGWSPKVERPAYRPSNHPDTKVLCAEFEKVAENHFPLSNLRSSVFANSAMLRAAAAGLYFGAEMPARLIHSIQPEEVWMQEFRRYSILVSLDLEAAFTLNKSLVLALYGSYGLAFGSLRGGVELLLRAVALNHLALNVRQLMQDPDAFANKRFLKEASLDLFRNHALAHESSVDAMSENAVAVTAWLQESGCEFHVSPAALFRQLEAWGYLVPIQNVREHIDYDWLSRNVHQNFSETDIRRRWFDTGPFEFPVPILPKELRRHIRLLARICDVIGVVSINSMWSRVGRHTSARNYLGEMQRMDAFRGAGLEFTAEAIRLHLSKGIQRFEKRA